MADNLKNYLMHCTKVFKWTAVSFGMPDADLSEYKKIAKFDSTLVENMEILSSMDNYYSWVGGVMKKYAGKRILDIGCGNGNLSNIFLDKEFVLGADYSKNYIKQINARFKDKKTSNLS